MKIKRRRNLEMIIQNIPPHPNPKVELEQYLTPANIASDIMWNAYTLGDIKDMNVVDLGCGTGIFSISSMLLGAKKVLGIDIDNESLEIAQKQSQHIGVYDENLMFCQKDICEISSIKDLTINGFLNNCDTLIQNPPFGYQERAKRHMDRKFIDLAMDSSDVIYSFHMKSAYDFVYDYFEKLGGKITHKFSYDFPIKKIYDFHTNDSVNVEVIVFRVENF